MSEMDAKTSQKNVYVVIGMARSGTSAIARGLKALGIDLGKKLEPANALWNPKGFWEDVDIVYKINRGVLYALQYTWMSVNLIGSLCKNNPDLQKFKKLAIDLLSERFANTQHWGFKDPRTAKLLPFWQDVFASMQLQEHYIIALRNPLASAYSYHRVSQTDLEIGLLLWLMHLIPAIDGSLGKKRVMVSYELLLKDAPAQLARIKQQLAIPDLADPFEIERYANEFLDKKLHHYDHNEAALKGHSATAVAPLCIKMYAFFMKIAKDEIAFDSEEFLTIWQSLKQEFNDIYPVYCYMDVLLKRSKQLERKLRTVEKSLPYKLTYPLRIIDDFLRKRRRKSREERRLLKAYE